MQEFDEIEKLWATHTVDVKISADEMLRQAKKEINAMRIKSLLNIAGMAISFFIVAGLWFFFDFQSWTTHLGISIIVIAVAVYTLILYNNYRIIAKNDFTVHPAEFIERLKRYQLNRLSLHNKLYLFYVIALSLGMVFYFVELLAHLQIFAQMAILLLSFGWMIFCSTLLRKAVIKKEKERIALLIEKFTRLSDQFKSLQ